MVQFLRPLFLYKSFIFSPPGSEWAAATTLKRRHADSGAISIAKSFTIVAMFGMETGLE
jgi:hypothetical protein